MTKAPRRPQKRVYEGGMDQYKREKLNTTDNPLGEYAKDKAEWARENGFVRDNQFLLHIDIKSGQWAAIEKIMALEIAEGKVFGEHVTKNKKTGEFYVERRPIKSKANNSWMWDTVIMPGLKAIIAGHRPNFKNWHSPANSITHETKMLRFNRHDAEVVAQAEAALGPDMPSQNRFFLTLIMDYVEKRLAEHGKKVTPPSGRVIDEKEAARNARKQKKEEAGMRAVTADILGDLDSMTDEEAEAAGREAEENVVTPLARGEIQVPGMSREGAQRTIATQVSRGHVAAGLTAAEARAQLEALKKSGVLPPPEVLAAIEVKVRDMEAEEAAKAGWGDLAANLGLKI